MPEIVIEARQAAISKSMKVKRILPFRLRRMVGPFIFMDHAGPVLQTPSSLSSLDVLPHPHIGLSTISYLFGRRDSYSPPLPHFLLQYKILFHYVLWEDQMKRLPGVLHAGRIKANLFLHHCLIHMHCQLSIASRFLCRYTQAADRAGNYKKKEHPLHLFQEALPTFVSFPVLHQQAPSDNSFIEHHIDKPYEIHLVEFETEQDFQDFSNDETRKQFLHLKEQSVKSVLLIKGVKL